MASYNLILDGVPERLHPKSFRSTFEINTNVWASREPRFMPYLEVCSSVLRLLMRGLGFKSLKKGANVHVHTRSAKDETAYLSLVCAAAPQEPPQRLRDKRVGRCVQGFDMDTTQQYLPFPPVLHARLHIGGTVGA
jgi:hypothetical protein